MSTSKKQRSNSLQDFRTALANEKRYQKAKLAEVAAQAYKRACAEIKLAVTEFERLYANEIQPSSGQQSSAKGKRAEAKPHRRKQVRKVQAVQEKPWYEEEDEDKDKAEPIPSRETSTGQFEQFNQQSFMELTNNE